MTGVVCELPKYERSEKRTVVLSRLEGIRDPYIPHHLTFIQTLSAKVIFFMNQAPHT